MNNQQTEVPVGIICKSDILKLIESSNLIADYETSCLQSCSYDLRIGTIFRDGQVINETHSRAEEQIIIEPGEIVSVLTLERLKLPKDIAGTAFAINSQSREGLMVLNPGHVDPGFEGPLSVKAINLRKVSLPISREDKIFTVIFEKIANMTEGYRTNISKKSREQEYNKKDLEVSPKGLFEIIKISKDDSFTTKQDVQKIITDHRMSQAIVFLSFVAAIAAVLAVIIGLYSIILSQQVKNQSRNSINASESTSNISTESSNSQNISVVETEKESTVENDSNQLSISKKEQIEKSD